MKIAPSILSADFANLERDIKLVEQYGADLIHIDAMDGHFVPNITLGPNVVSAIRKITNLTLDCHLMIANPEQYIDAFAKAGADIITIHYEATNHLHKALQQIKSHQIKCGVVINPATPVCVIEPILNMVDVVLVMTVNPGFGGQSFINETLLKIKQLDNLRKVHHYLYEIEVDGGINDKTVKLCQENGVDIAVAGSYIYDALDIKQAIESLK